MSDRESIKGIDTVCKTKARLGCIVGLDTRLGILSDMSRTEEVLLNN